MMIVRAKELIITYPRTVAFIVIMQVCVQVAWKATHGA